MENGHSFSSSGGGRALAARVALLTAVMAVALATFTWPAARLEPRDLPVGVAGAAPPALADPGAFDLRRYASAADARRAVLDREVYGAFAGRTLFIATGASPAVAGALREAAAGARVVDLAPGTAKDPRAATLGALALSLTLIGILTAVLATLTAPRLRERLVVVAGGAVGAGLVAALLTHTWLDALPGPWLGIAGAVALAVAAVAAGVTGLAAVAGRPGLALGAVLMMFVGNPWSGLSSAPELLPQVAGTVGQLLPTGASGSLLRSVAWFDGAGARGEVLVLGAWALAGSVLLAAAELARPPRRVARAAPAAA